MGGGGGGSNTVSTQTIQKSDPWSGAQPYISRALSLADALSYGGPQQYFPGQTYAPMNPYTNQALQQTAQIAQQGSPTTTAANTYLQNQLNAGPDPMNNPYLKGAINQAQGDVMSKVNAQFAGSNYGGSAHEEWLGRKLQDAALPYISQAYQQNQQALNQASMLAPNTQAAQYNAPAQLANVGTAYQNEAQQSINDQIARWNFNQQAPWNMVNNYSQLVNGGNMGSSSSSTQQQPYYTNPLAQAMGLGLGGLSLYNGLNGAGLFGGGASGGVPLSTTMAGIAAGLAPEAGMFAGGVGGMTAAQALAAGLIAL